MTVQLGPHSYIGSHHVWEYQEEEPATITTGAYCSIADDVEFLPGGMHRTDTVSTFPWQRVGRDEGYAATQRGPITIGHDVWICRGARILGGVTIGNGAIIGAYAVVAGDIPAYHVAVGNPARYHPRPTHAPWATHLNRIGWWNWPPTDPRLADVARLPVAEFCRKYG